MDETTTGPGQAGVHSHLGVEPSKGQASSGSYGPSDGGESALDSAKHRASEIAGQAHERVSGAADQARERMHDVRGRAEEMAGQARERASGLMDQAENSQPIRMAQDNALPALGIAFAAGFLLAGSSDSAGRFGKAKQQIRGAVMGGISAALAQELRGMVNMDGGKGLGGLMDSLLGNPGGERGARAARGGGSDF